MEFVVDPGHPCLAGHFPGRPLVPGVVVLDRVAEAIERAHGPLPSLRLPRVKFLQPLLPGERAWIELQPVAEASPPRWRFQVLRDGTTIASGEMAAGAPEAPE